MSDMVFCFFELGFQFIIIDFDGWIKIEGELIMCYWIQNILVDGSMILGIWEVMIGMWYVIYQFYEFVYLIEGCIIIIFDGGVFVMLNFGDVFVVELIFKGIWIIEVLVCKYFVIKLKQCLCLCCLLI